MPELKKIRPEAVARALERVERYRLLNQPRVAESICNDILAVSENNQQALVGLLLALTDQFGPEAKIGVNAALEYVPRLEGEYAQAYYAGIVWERHAKSRLNRSYPGSGFDAFDELQRALEAGADEYVHKPFSIHQMALRIKSLSRRARSTE